MEERPLGLWQLAVHGAVGLLAFLALWELSVRLDRQIWDQVQEQVLGSITAQAGGH